MWYKYRQYNAKGSSVLLLQREFLFYFMPFISLASQFLLRILKRISSRFAGCWQPGLP